MTAYTSALRSQPKAETALKIAEQFAVSLTSLYADPEDCLREALEHFSEAPIRDAVRVPQSALFDGVDARAGEVVTLAEKRGKTTK